VLHPNEVRLVARAWNARFGKPIFGVAWPTEDFVQLHQEDASPLTRPQCRAMQEQVRRQMALLECGFLEINRRRYDIMRLMPPR